MGGWVGGGRAGSLNELLDSMGGGRKGGLNELLDSILWWVERWIDGWRGGWVGGFTLLIFPSTSGYSDANLGLKKSQVLEAWVARSLESITRGASGPIGGWVGGWVGRGERGGWKELLYAWGG